MQILKWGTKIIRRIIAITLTRQDIKPNARGKPSSPNQPKENFNAWCSMNNGNSDSDQYADKVNGGVQDAKEYIENRSGW